MSSEQELKKINGLKGLSPNEKRIKSCKKVGGAKKKIGHQREEDFNKQFNPDKVGEIEYGAKADCRITNEEMQKELREKLKVDNFNTSNKSGKNIQFTLGKIPELDKDDNLEYMKNNNIDIFNKYLKKTMADTPADLMVYMHKELQKWIFFNMDDIVNYIATKCSWRKIEESGRLKGDFTDNSKKGQRQYLTYEYRRTHKSFFLGLNGNKGLSFIQLLMDKKYGIKYHTKEFNF
jgi:hypothetical protein